jgi:hypothetical protein
MTELEITLLDGTLLLVSDVPVASRLAEELETWALVPHDAAAEVNRADPGLWLEALQAGQLVSAALGGLAADSTAWRVFPQAAEFLTSIVQRHPPLDAVAVVLRAQEQIGRLTGEDPDTLSLMSAAANSQGAWSVQLCRGDGSLVQLRLNATGTVLEIDLRDQRINSRQPPVPQQAQDTLAPSTEHPRAFVCYAHESEDHKETVREFTEFLRAHGIDAQSDRWQQDSRRDWHVWAEGQIRAADFVLVIASPLCKVIGNGGGDPRKNSGLRTELTLLRELNQRYPDEWQGRMFPVILPSFTMDDIPDFMKPASADHYEVTDFTIEGAETLLRHLTKQEPYVAPPVKPIPRLDPYPARYRVTDGGADS